jgi:antitoxin component YwqK of YwqJK toxin-antitoxin module
VTFKNGDRDGVSTYWDEHGQKRAEGTFKNGKRDGVLTEWDENGVKTQVLYQDGKEVSDS